MKFPVRFRFSLAILLLGMALIGVVLTASMRWRAVFRDTGSQAHAGGTSCQTHPREAAAIEFLESRGFHIFEGKPNVRYKPEKVPLDERVRLMRADIQGYGEMYLFFWFDQPYVFRGKERDSGMGYSLYADAPWFYKDACAERVQELKETYEELDCWETHWYRYRKPFPETVQMLKDGYFKGKDTDQVYAETADLWKK